ncbi:MAG TPA: hypothetical protein VFW68_06280 [Rhodocyclaceae bacterium]|nr:hypothetical protein [Rhodocyclaceae bacterium]
MVRISSLLASAFLGLGLFAAGAFAADRPFAVIAAPSASDHRLTREAVALIFRRKLSFWDNGQRIQPVNLPPVHPLRRNFSLSVLGQPPEALDDYWREMYFHGVRPPHVLASEEAVALFVAATPGAIGYVSTCIPEGKVTVVFAAGDLPGCAR